MAGRLDRESCVKMSRLASATLDFTAAPLQVGMNGCPWRVAVASILLNRTQHLTVRAVLRVLFERWPSAALLANAPLESVAECIAACGMQNRRARILTSMSRQWLGDEWTDMRDLPGVGLYVADAVGLFCFGQCDLQSSDHVLRAHVEKVRTS